MYVITVRRSGNVDFTEFFKKKKKKERKKEKKKKERKKKRWSWSGHSQTTVSRFANTYR